MQRKKQQRRKRRRFPFVLGLLGAAVIGVAAYAGVLFWRSAAWTSPETLLTEYMAHIPAGEYEEMYAMLDAEASGGITQEEFVQRNSAIYEGIELQNLQVEVTGFDEGSKTVTYQCAFDTAAGPVSFENAALFAKGKDSYRLIWSDSLIFPGLDSADKVRVLVTEAERGRILDRTGRVLAGPGVASSVGIVPGKLKNRAEAVQRLAELLETDPKIIENKLSAQWVKADSFVPIQIIPKVKEVDLMKMEPDADVLAEQERQEKILEIPGVMITDTPVREYPLGEAAAHLIGYVQNVTAEDLTEHEGEGYTSNSVIGRSGMEALYEEELKGQNGCRIYVEDATGNIKWEIAGIPKVDGEDVQLTIDADLQESLYRQFQEDKSCSVAMNPYSGEVLALVSTPSYDNNEFIMGLSDEKWQLLNEDEDQPMYNRFRQIWCPGSVFKPVTAAVGLTTGAVNPDEDYGNVGLSWQKDSTWGNYYVTTLQEYSPVVLENALIYSDNIYFAKAALNIGADALEQALTRLGFGSELPFEIVMTASRYSNTERIETEIQLADSGYGQGQILMNPLHLACIYTAFCNEGNIIRPYLTYQEGKAPEYWMAGAFSPEVAARVLEGIKKVVNDPYGTGYGAHREDVILAGKTGTAEIKATTEDTTGTELGWFAAFTAEKTTENPILLISMTEDVKDRGGSGYVVEKDNAVLDEWFARR